MLRLVLHEQKRPKNLMVLAVATVFLYGLYLFLDVLANASVPTLIEEWGLGLFVLHQFLNLTMAVLAGLMISTSHINLRLNGSEPKGGTSIPFFSFIFGLLTFGCAPCVVAFLSAIGIAFTPIVLPFGNLPWKLLLLGLLAGGLAWIFYSIQTTTCGLRRAEDRSH